VLTHGRDFLLLALPKTGGKVSVRVKWRDPGPLQTASIAIGVGSADVQAAYEMLQ